MTDNVKIKVCGLRDAKLVTAAVDAGASYVGFVFFPKSPRNVSLQVARELALGVRPGVAKVALSVDADDALLDQITEAVPLDMLQLHGSETPERVMQVRERYRIPVMKAVGVASEEDLPDLAEYGRVADQLLVDAKPPKGAILPGGNGLAFDWRLIAGRRWPVPWMLAGGLTDKNVAEAIRLTGARQVDVSSGVETAPGVKDSALIASFVQKAQA